MTSPEHAASILASQFAAALHRATAARRTYVETLGAQSVKDGNVMGTVELTGAGEAMVELNFPVHFLEKPIFTAGLELGDNLDLQRGAFPTYSASVGSWKTRLLAGNNLYVGATVCVVTYNAPRSYLHFSFQGRSLTNPVGQDLSVETIL